MKTVVLLLDELIEEVRTCACGCGTQFIARKTSRRIYYRRKHKNVAKAYRRKLRDAGVEYDREHASPLNFNSDLICRSVGYSILVSTHSAEPGEYERDV